MGQSPPADSPAQTALGQLRAARLPWLRGFSYGPRKGLYVLVDYPPGTDDDTPKNAANLGAIRRLVGPAGFYLLDTWEHQRRQDGAAVMLWQFWWSRHADDPTQETPRACLDCDNIYRGDLKCPACGNHSGEPLDG